MSPTTQAILNSWTFDPKIALGLVASLIIYLHGWCILRRSAPQRFPLWRALAFTGGLAAFWLATASPLDAFSGLLLSAHMVQHLLLLSVAPPLILLGSPLLPLLRGLPRKFARDGVGPFLVWPALRGAGNTITHPVTCWIIMAITLCAWHVPAAFDLTLRSPAWHKAEHVCFFGASLLFWWPVVRPFPSRPHWPLWSVPVYLLAADLLNTALSAILTFSDHLLYPHYLEVPRLLATTALGDQSCAGVIMWVPGSLVFLIPAASIAIQFLSPSHLLVRPPSVHTDRRRGLPALPAWLFETLTGYRVQSLINTPLQRGDPKKCVFRNRFNGFRKVWESVKVYLFSALQSQRDCVLQPGVARNELPWVEGRTLSNPERVPATALNIYKTVCPSQAALITPLKQGVNESRRFDMLSVPLLGPFLRAQSGRRLLQATLLLIAIAVIVDGLFGPQVSSANLAGVLPWTYWRALVVIALLAAGNFFCMACPFMLFRELGRRLGLRQRSWPRALRSKWIGVGLLALFFWGYEAFNLWDKPIWTAWLIINYFLLAFAIDALFSGASFCKYVCPIGQFQFVASLVSPLEVKVREPGICSSCKTHDCLRGNARQRGCEMNLYLPRKSGNLDCTFCLDCVRACPHDNVGVMATAPGLDVVRDPQRASIGRLARRPDIAALGLVFVFAAFASAAMMVGPISNWRDHLATRLNLASNLPVTSLFFIVALILAPVILVCGSVLAGRAAAGIKAPARELIRRFSLALVPLAAGMWAAHFSFHFLVGWKSAWPIFQRIAGDLGLAVASRQMFSGSSLRMDNVQILQTLLLDIGLLTTLYLGWRIARAYAPRLRLALRVMAPWSAAAVGLYLFGVWTCLQPMQMRGLPGPLS
jgi:cytochrome c oxidase assembly factor CtaG/ferredoxin